MPRLGNLACLFAVLVGFGCSGSSATPDAKTPRAAAAAPGSADAPSPLPAIETVYVSGYGPDISVFELDTSAASLTKRSSAKGGAAPSYLAFTSDHRFAYAIDEAAAPHSQVAAFAIERPSGALRPLNTAATGGSGAPHLAVHPSGRWLAVAHYTSGHTTILPIGDDGRVGAAGTPNKGPGDGCENAHQAVFDRGGTHLLVPCLGSNYVLQFKFDAGQLSYNDPPTVAVAGGPRHLAFDPDESHVYVLSELDSLITSFEYDATTGRLREPRSIPSFERMKGSSAHIAVHPGGKWLYASNRTENSLGLFSIDASGRPHPVSFVTDMIATPRDFSLDPAGRFLIAANQAGAQNVLVFRIDASDGRLTRASVAAVGGQPTFTRALVLSP